MASRRILALAARTTAQSAVALTPIKAQRALVVLNVTAASGTGGLTLTVTGYVNDIAYTILTASAAVTATGVKVYAIGAVPQALTGGITQVAQTPLPERIDISVAVGDASSYTYEIVVHLGDRTTDIPTAITGTLSAGALEVGSGSSSLSLIKKGTFTLNPASIADSESAIQTVTITGAQVGDVVILIPPAAFENLVVGQALVSAADTVKFGLQNDSGGAIDAANATWGYLLLRVT